MPPATRTRHSGKANSMLDNALEHHPVGTVICDVSNPQEGAIVRFVNREFVRVTGFDPDSIVGEPIANLHGKDKSKNMNALRTMCSSGKGGTVVVRNKTKDGKAFWNKIQIAPMTLGSTEIAEGKKPGDVIVGADGTVAEGRVLAYMVGTVEDVSHCVRLKRLVMAGALGMAATLAAGVLAYRHFMGTEGKLSFG